MVKLLLFFLIPALELYLLVKVGSKIGALNMVLWVFASAGLGIWAVREQGQSTINKVRSELSAGRVPQDSIVNGLLIFLGGVLLILPGVISDALGIFLLIPFTRKLFLVVLTQYLVRQQAKQPGQGSGASQFIFFSSTGGFPAGAPSQMDFSSEEPRQATVIECTAHEVEAGQQSVSTTEDAGNATGRAASQTTNPEHNNNANTVVFDCEPASGDTNGPKKAD